jgi:hypothetical protein
LQSYGFAVLSPGNITNSGSWTLTGDVAVTASGAVNFTNLGSFVKSGGTATTNWQVPISGSGTINIESGTLNLYGASTGTITGKITVGSGATLQYGQGGTLENAEVTGKGTFNFTASATVTGTYSFTATAQIQGGTVSFDGLTTAATLNIQGGTASFNAAITVANFNLTSGSADFNVTATTAIGNLTFSGGNLTMNSIASLNAGTLTLSASSTLNLQLGSGTASIQVSGSVDLAGNLNFSTTVGYDPAIGTLIPVLVFANGFSGNFGSIGGLSLGDGDGLSVDLSNSGFSLTVTNPPTGSFQRAGSQPASSFKSRPPAR